MPRPLLIRGMWGLGDNVYQRAFVKMAAALNERRRVATFLDTPWPQLYSDLPVRFVLQPRGLRTQMANVERVRGLYEAAPRGTIDIRVSYGHEQLARGSILDSMARCFAPAFGNAPVGPPEFDLPDMGASVPVATSRPIALVRPVTIRREWRNEARNPEPAYIAKAADELRGAGFYVVVVADLKDGEEWLAGDMPDGDRHFVRGELTMPELIELARASTVLVGGVGWIVPAAVALGVPAFVVLGGMGAHNAPEVILPNGVDVSHIEFAIPEEFCRCSQMRHLCKTKEIPDFEEQLRSFVARVRPRSSKRSRKVAA